MKHNEVSSASQHQSGRLRTSMDKGSGFVCQYTLSVTLARVFLRGFSIKCESCGRCCWGIPDDEIALAGFGREAGM